MVSLRFVALSGLALALQACSPAASPNSNAPLQTANPDVSVPMGQVVRGAGIEKTQAQPDLIPVKLDRRCRLPKASRNARIVFVSGHTGGRKSKGLLTAYKDAKTRDYLSYQGHAPINLVVTDTSQPVFIVIGARSQNMWTLQTAPGVKIDGVILSAKHGASVANLPDEAKIGFVMGKGSPQKCAFEFTKAIHPDELIAANKRVSYQPTAQDLQRYERSYRDKLKWFKTTFPKKYGGEISEQIHSSASQGFGGVLIGPVPDTPFEAAPVTRVHYPEHMNVAWGTREEATAQLDAYAQAALEALYE
ncbi:MAG: hypothetical protein AAGF20_05780 [Pseudomonadota bacterium]